jgi:hypothetical protein
MSEAAAADRCPRCGALLKRVGHSHRDAVTTPRRPEPPSYAKSRHHPDKRRAYMREYMRQRRAATAARLGDEGAGNGGPSG